MKSVQDFTLIGGLMEGCCWRIRMTQGKIILVFQEKVKVYPVFNV